MKKMFLCAGVLTSLLLASCNSAKENDVEAIPFQSKEDGKWGMIKTDGEVLFEEEFIECPTVVRNGRFMVKNANDLWEIYTADKKPQQVGKDEYLGIISFSADVTPAVKKGERITLIDKDGKVKATLDKAGGQNIKRCYGFHEGYARIYTDKGYGLINTSGKVVIEPNYCEMTDCSDGKIVAIENKYADTSRDECPYVVLNTSGKVMHTIKAGKYKEIGSYNAQYYKHGRLVVCQTEDGERKSGLIDDKGEVVLKPSEKNRYIIQLSEKYFTFYDGDGCGLKDNDGEVIIRAKYDGLKLDPYVSSVIWAADDNKWKLLDLEGNEITDEEYYGVTDFYDGKHAFVRIGKKEMGMIDISGKEIKGLPDIYDISTNNGDEYVNSDYIDIDALVEAFGITPTSIGIFKIDMTPEQAAQAWTKEKNEDTEVLPKNFTKYELSYVKEAEGVSIKYTLGYKSRMVVDMSSSWWSYDYQWADIKPVSIYCSTSGTKIANSVDKVYEKLLAKIKGMGKVFKEGNCGVAVTIKEELGIVLKKESGDIIIELCASDTYKDVPITDVEMRAVEEELEGYEGYEE